MRYWAALCALFLALVPEVSLALSQQDQQNPILVEIEV